MKDNTDVCFSRHLSEAIGVSLSFTLRGGQAVKARRRRRYLEKRACDDAEGCWESARDSQS